MTHKPISRRTILQGTGVSLALPLLESMLDRKGHVHWGEGVKAADNTKLIIFHWPYGIPANGPNARVQGPPSDHEVARNERFFPRATGTVNTLPAAKDQAPEFIRPLYDSALYGDFHADINLVSGLTADPIYAYACSHGHCVSVFSGYPGPSLGGTNCDRERNQRSTVDVVAAQRMGGRPLAIMMPEGVSGSAKAYGGDAWNWSEDPQGLLTGVNAHRTLSLPSEIWNDLFKSVSDGSGGGNPTPVASAQKKSALDLILKSSERLKSRLGGADKVRLEEHLATLRSIESSFTGGGTAPVVPADCKTIAKPVDSYSFLASGSARRAYGDFDQYTNDLIRLGVLALRCNLTRVLFISLGPSQNDTGKLNHVSANAPFSIHTCQHGNENSGSNQDANNQYAAIATWMMKKFAYLLQQLKNPSDPGGDMLSQSAVVATSEFNYGGSHDINFLPVIVAGQARPMVTGKHIALKAQDSAPTWSLNLPGTSDRCINDLWQSALQAVGTHSVNDKFGDTGRWNPTAITGLWST